MARDRARRPGAAALRLFVAIEIPDVAKAADDDLLEGLARRGEDHVAQTLGHLAHHRVHDARCCLETSGFRREPDLGFAGGREVGNGRVRERAEQVVQQLGNTRLADARASDGSGYDSRRARERGELGKHRAFHHLHHLERDAGHRVDTRAPGQLRDETRRSTADRRDVSAPLRHLRLAQVVVRHRPSGAREFRAEEAFDLGPDDHRDVQERGERVTGHVVLGRSEAAGHEDHVGPLGGFGEDLDDALEIVAHDAMVQDVDADLREALRHPTRVLVGDLTEQQLGSDGDDLGPHPADPRARPRGRVSCSAMVKPPRRGRS
jgi:hypothetical protein